MISYTGGIQNLQVLLKGLENYEIVLKLPGRQVVDNRDGTRSLLNRANKKLLVTFRAENQVKHSIIFQKGIFPFDHALFRTMTRLLLLCLQLLQVPVRVHGH